MARIKTYTVDTLISDNDIVIGSDRDNNDQTKNFQVADLRQYVLSGLEPEVGGNLKITTLSDESLVYLTPESWINSQDPAVTVLHYEIVFLILNGRTYIFRKNNGIYGVGNLQAVSNDFTEIDITSVITANLQGISSVLTEGNEAPLQTIKVGSMYLWDSYNNDAYGAIVYGDRDRINFNKANGSLIGSIDSGEIQVKTNGTSNFLITFPSVASNRTATFQDASGTVAYVDDIPEVPVLDVVAGTNVTITDVDGVFTVNSIERSKPYVTSIQLRDSVTNTTYFSDGQLFEYNETTSPIDSVRFVFNENIEIQGPTFQVVQGRVRFRYENGKCTYRNLTYSVATFGSNYIEFQVPFDLYWNNFGAIPGNFLNELSFSLTPGELQSVSSLELFDGVISNFLSEFIHSTGTYE